MDEPLSDAAETFLTLLYQEHMCELANHAIQSEHVRYGSSAEATKAMLRGAYRRGALDQQPAREMETDIAQVNAANEAAKRHG